MKYYLYAVQDAVNNFSIPMAQTNDATAMRSFAHEVGKEDSLWHTHKSDFSLWLIGEFDNDTGEVSPIIPKVICRATDF